MAGRTKQKSEAGSEAKETTGKTSPKKSPAKPKKAAPEYKTVHRSLLKEAPYNPRSIDPIAFDKLVKIVRKNGLVQPPVWNKRTGYIVGGHQRLKANDKVKGTVDYELMVCVVDMDDAEEKALNIALNNQDAQGAYDLDKLSGLLTDIGLDRLESTGFDESGLSSLYDSMGGELPTIFVEPDLVDVELNPARAAAAAQAAEVVAAKKPASSIEEIKAKKKKFAEEQAAKNDVNIMFNVVFASANQKAALLEELKIDPDAKYIDGTVLLEYLGINFEE